MSELFVILVSTVLVNNFVLVRFLGLCPFMGVSNNLEAAAGMSLATAFVLTLSSASAYLLHEYVLVPLELQGRRRLEDGTLARDRAAGLLDRVAQLEVHRRVGEK